MKRWVRLPSPAMVVALAALFVALGGSATSAVLITSADIKNGTVRGIDVRNSSLTRRDVRNGSLTGGDVRDNSLRGRDVNESTLAKVPNANRLDGLDSARFARVKATGTETLDFPAIPANSCDLFEVQASAGDISDDVVVVTGDSTFPVSTTHAAIDTSLFELWMCNDLSGTINPPEEDYNWIVLDVP